MEAFKDACYTQDSLLREILESPKDTNAILAARGFLTLSEDDLQTWLESTSVPPRRDVLESIADLLPHGDKPPIRSAPPMW
jgi:hypothetical protein